MRLARDISRIRRAAGQGISRKVEPLVGLVRQPVKQQVPQAHRDQDKHGVSRVADRLVYVLQKLDSLGRGHEHEIGAERDIVGNEQRNIERRQRHRHPDVLGPGDKVAARDAHERERDDARVLEKSRDRGDAPYGAARPSAAQDRTDAAENAHRKRDLVEPDARVDRVGENQEFAQVAGIQRQLRGTVHPLHRKQDVGRRKRAERDRRDGEHGAPSGGSLFASSGHAAVRPYQKHHHQRADGKRDEVLRAEQPEAGVSPFPPDHVHAQEVCQGLGQRGKRIHETHLAFRLVRVLQGKQYSEDGSCGVGAMRRWASGRSRWPAHSIVGILKGETIAIQETLLRQPFDIPRFRDTACRGARTWKTRGPGCAQRVLEKRKRSWKRFVRQASIFSQENTKEGKESRDLPRLLSVNSSGRYSACYLRPLVCLSFPVPASP